MSLHSVTVRILQRNRISWMCLSRHTARFTLRNRLTWWCGPWVCNLPWRLAGWRLKETWILRQESGGRLPSFWRHLQRTGQGSLTIKRITCWFKCWASPVAQTVKNLPAVWETQVWSLGWEDFLEKGMAAHSTILAWRIPYLDCDSRTSLTEHLATRS